MPNYPWFKVLHSNLTETNRSSFCINTKLSHVNFIYIFCRSFLVSCTSFLKLSHFSGYTSKTTFGCKFPNITCQNIFSNIYYPTHVTANSCSNGIDYVQSR